MSKAYFFVNVLKINDENKDENIPLMLYAKMVYPMRMVKSLMGCLDVFKIKKSKAFPTTINTITVARVLIQCLSASIKVIAV